MESRDDANSSRKNKTTVSNNHESSKVQKENESSLAVHDACPKLFVTRADVKCQKNCDTDGKASSNLECVSPERLIFKERKKLQKKKLADEKKRQREEEYRLKLFPKDKKVTLLSRSYLELMQQFSDAHNSSFKAKANALLPDRSDFPTLGEACSKQKRAGSGTSPCREDSHSNETNVYRAIETEHDSEPNTATSTLNKRDKIATSKRARWKNAVTVDLLHIAKNQAALKQGESKKKRSTRLRKDSNITLCGNPLDSSHPERKRGKFREKEKVKLSTLKKIIRDELQRTRKQKAECLEDNKILKQVSNDGQENKSNHILKQDSIDDQGNDAISHKMPVCTTFLDILNQVTELEKCYNSGSVSNLHSPSSEKIRNNDSGAREDSPFPTFELMGEETSSESHSSVPSQEIEGKRLTIAMPKPVVHSRKFRDYCDHFVTPEINDLASKLILELRRLQDQQYQRDPIKSRSKRRYIVGLHEMKKYLALKKIKLLIIATDIDNIESPGGLNEIISQLKETAVTQNIPYVFALQRRKIGYLTLKKGPISCLGVLNYQACECHVNEVLEAVALARTQYSEACQGSEESCKEMDVLEPQPAPAGESDDTINEIIGMFIAALRSESPTEFLQFMNSPTVN